MKRIKQNLKPGKDNKEERLNFVRFWARYVRDSDDKEWSRQQNIIVDSQLKSAREKHVDDNKKFN